MTAYIDGSTVDECRDLLQRGERLEVLAVRLRVSPDDLARLLGLHHQPRGRAAAAGDDDVDLWAGERLQGGL
jgi:hypothetical protein